jgi:hypothetical protein
MSSSETLAEARKADRISGRSRELARLRQQREQIDYDMGIHVAGLRRDGVSWATIGDLLAVSRQAAEQRYSVKKP